MDYIFEYSIDFNVHNIAWRCDMKNYIFVAVNRTKWNRKRKYFHSTRKKFRKTLPKCKRKWYSVDVISNVNNCRNGGKSMLMGEVIKERLNCLGISFKDFAEETMLEESFLQDIMENRILPIDIDPIDLNIIANVLYCSPEYLIDENSRNKDVVFCSMNRGDTTTKSNLAKAKLQSFMRELLFVKGCE